MTEKELIDAIVQRARGLGWKVARFPKVPVKYPGQPIRWMTPVAADSKGFPDLLLVRDRVLAVEVKAAETGGVVVQPEQHEWLMCFKLARAYSEVWTVKDWRDGTVDKALTARLPAPGLMDPLAS